MAPLVSIRELLRRHFSHEAFLRLRLWWWYGHFYLPHLFASIFVQHSPKLQGYPDHETSQLVRQLSHINVFAPTKMCRVMTKYGSDKGQGWHNYTAIYSVLFGRFRDRPLRIFELGLGTNNPNFAFNMGPNGQPGASLRAWRELFPHALIYGADIDREVLFEEDRIQTFYCDQTDKEAIKDLWSQPALRLGVDVIIDDGLHTLEANTSFLDESLGQLNPGGYYVIEDIFGETIMAWHQRLNAIYLKRWPGYEFVIVELPNPRNNIDNNNLLLIGRVGQVGHMNSAVRRTRDP